MNLEYSLRYVIVVIKNAIVCMSYDPRNVV